MKRPKVKEARRTRGGEKLSAALEARVKALMRERYAKPRGYPYFFLGFGPGSVSSKSDK